MKEGFPSSLEIERERFELAKKNRALTDRNTPMFGGRYRQAEFWVKPINSE